MIDISEDTLVEEVDPVTGEAAKTLGTYVLCSYLPLGADPNDKHLWSTAREVAHWVQETAALTRVAETASRRVKVRRRRSGAGTSGAGRPRRAARAPDVFVPGKRK